MHIVIDARIRRSGTGRYADRLLEHLQAVDRVNRYTVLLEPGDTWRAVADNFKMVPCKYKQFSFSPIEQIGFARQLYGLKPDLVHFTMTQQPILYFGRIVTTTHDLTMLYYTRPGRLPAWVHAIRMAGYKFLFWWGHKKSRRIIVPSNFVSRKLAELHPFTKDKIVVTYEAADVIPGKAKRPDGVKKSFIFHVGSPFPHKNIDRLVEAYKELTVDSEQRRDKPLQLVLAGKREHYFARLESKIKKMPAAKNIVLPGRVSDEELLWLYKNAEAYVLPSLSEGFGLPGVEAMLHGCPLVASNATCLPEIYDGGAHYFNPESTEDMARAIKEVLSSKILRDDLISKGKERAAQFSWQKMAQQTLETYQQSLKP